MMRKEVKLGFVIGGVLLSVLIVYVLVITGRSDQPEQVALTKTESPEPAAEKTTTPQVTPPDAPKAMTVAAPTTPPTTPAAVPPVSEVASATPATKPEQNTDPFKTSLASGESPAPTTQTANAAPIATDDSKKSSEGESWGGGVLQTGLPVLMSETPQKPQNTKAPMPTTPAAPTGGNSNAAVANRPSERSNRPAAVANAPASITPPANTNAAPAALDSSRTNASARTHTVAAGETFSSIAAMVSSSKTYYLQIAAANPTVDPKKLHPGTVINLPAENASKPAIDAQPAMATQARRPESAVNSSTEYRVVSGDTLIRIANKLYGKSEKADQIYDLNRPLIGSNPAKIKPDMVLKLPEAPTVAIK